FDLRLAGANSNAILIAVGGSPRGALPAGGKPTKLGFFDEPSEPHAPHCLFLPRLSLSRGAEFRAPETPSQSVRYSIQLIVRAPFERPVAPLQPMSGRKEYLQCVTTVYTSFHPDPPRSETRW